MVLCVLGCCVVVFFVLLVCVVFCLFGLWGWFFGCCRWLWFCFCLGWFWVFGFGLFCCGWCFWLFGLFFGVFFGLFLGFGVLFGVLFGFGLFLVVGLCLVLFGGWVLVVE